MNQSNINQETEQKPRLSTKTSLINALTIALLVFLTPIGLLVMWLFASWSKKAKIIITIVVVLIPVLIMGYILKRVLDTIRSPDNPATDKRIIAFTEHEIKGTQELLEYYYSKNNEYPTSLESLKSWALLDTPNAYWPIYGSGATTQEHVQYRYQKVGSNGYKLWGEVENEIIYFVEKPSN